MASPSAPIPHQQFFRVHAKFGFRDQATLTYDLDFAGSDVQQYDIPVRLLLPGGMTCDKAIHSHHYHAIPNLQLLSIDGYRQTCGFLCYRPAMKRAFVLSVALCMALPLTAQRTAAQKPEVNEQPMSVDEAAIWQISEDWVRFYNTGDAAKVAALYTEDGYYLSAHILAHGKQAIEAYWARGIKAGGHMDFIKPLTVYYSGDLAYCAGTYQATNAGVTVDGRILIVLKKVNGKWLIAAHETVVRDQPL